MDTYRICILPSEKILLHTTTTTKTTTIVEQLKLNVMKQNQYDAANKNPSELYMITDVKVSYNDLENKPNNLVTHMALASVGDSTTSVFANSSGVITRL